MVGGSCSVPLDDSAFRERLSAMVPFDGCTGGRGEKYEECPKEGRGGEVRALLWENGWELMGINSSAAGSMLP